MARAALAAAAFFGWFLVAQFARAGARLDPAEVLAMVRQVNAETGGWFNEADVMAVIEVESSFNPSAYRFEPRLNDASIGLMQVLFSTAKDRGYTGGPAGLFDPLTNIRIGMAHLKWSFDTLSARMGEAPTDNQWIGSYNIGVGAVLRGRVPLVYVNKWKLARRKYV